LNVIKPNIVSGRTTEHHETIEESFYQISFGRSPERLSVALWVLCMVLFQDLHLGTGFLSNHWHSALPPKRLLLFLQDNYLLKCFYR